MLIFDIFNRFIGEPHIIITVLISIMLLSISEKRPLRSWLFSLCQYASEEAELLLVGNKLDCETDRIISRQQGERVCSKHTLHQQQCSFLHHWVSYREKRWALCSNLHEIKINTFGLKLHRAFFFFFWCFSFQGCLYNFIIANDHVSLWTWAYFLQFASRISGMRFCEASAKDNFNVDEIFLKLVDDIISKVESEWQI